MPLVSEPIRGNVVQEQRLMRRPLAISSISVPRTTAWRPTRAHIGQEAIDLKQVALTRKVRISRGQGYFPMEKTAKVQYGASFKAINIESRSFGDIFSIDIGVPTGRIRVTRCDYRVVRPVVP